MALFSDDTKVAKPMEERIGRGRERLESIAPQRDEAWEFFRGNHYAYVDEKRVLQFLSTVTTVRGTGKPRHRARQTRNLILDHVLHAVAAATSRVPSYQVAPATGDPDDKAAAKMSEQVALYGYDAWELHQTTVDAVLHAIVGGEAFAWPYFDNTIGDYIHGEGVGTGDVRVRTFGSNECYWEPGIRFEESPWHAVEHAQPIDAVKAMDGFLDVKLTADAESRALSGRGKDSNKRKLVLVTHYLECPTPRNPKGLWATLANGKRIFPDRPYPGSEQVLRKLSYAPDPDSDRDLGLVSQLLDAQRTFNDANNKAVEYKNHGLFPRVFAHPGTLKKQRWTDEIGKVYEVPNPEQNVKLVEVSGIPSELFEMVDRAERDMGRIAGQNTVPSQVESGEAIQRLLERDASRFGLFIGSLAKWHSRVMRDCLVLVQRHYTEERLLQIRGDFGWEPIRDFATARLQTDVRVMPDSIEPRTKQAVEQRVMNYVQAGFIGREEAMNAIETGSTDQLVRSIVNDQERAARIIQRIKEGEEALFSMPLAPTGRMEKIPMLDPTGQPILDPMTGQPITVETGKPEMSPGYMPRYSDNLKVFRSTFEDFMKTEEYEMLEPSLQTATADIFAGILILEAEQAAEAQAAQMAQAEQLGMGNAAKPQGVKPLPSFPAMNGDQNKTSSEIPA